MALLHAKALKYVAAGGNLDAAAENTLTNEEVAVECIPAIAALILSTSPSPARRVRVGREFKLRGALAEASKNEYAAAYGGDLADDTLTLDQDVADLTLYDIGIVAYDDSGAEKEIEITDMQFTEPMTMSLKSGAFEVLTFQLEGTSASVLTREF